MRVFYNVEITHVFPVRGHSYSQCDRNFGIYGRVLKKVPIIQSAVEYLRLIAESRSNPSHFWVIWDTELLKDWKSVLVPLFTRKPTKKKVPFQLQQYCRLKLMPTGFVSASRTYASEDFEQFSYWKDNNIRAPDVSVDLQTIKGSPVKAAKEADVRELFDCIDDGPRAWFEQVFEKSHEGAAAESSSDSGSEQLDEE